MKNPHEAPPLAIRFFLLLGLVSMLVPSCCPSGAWEDNFGRSYTLVTIRTTQFVERPGTYGTVDTRDMGCGVWSIRPPAEDEPPVNPDNPVAWVAENPYPNPDDLCCYAFRFDGHVAEDSGCSEIIGTYENFTPPDLPPKCEGRSGPMSLVTAP